MDQLLLQPAPALVKIIFCDWHIWHSRFWKKYPGKICFWISESLKTVERHICGWYVSTDSATGWRFFLARLVFFRALTVSTGFKVWSFCFSIHRNISRPLKHKLVWLFAIKIVLFVMYLRRQRHTYVRIVPSPRKCGAWSWLGLICDSWMVFIRLDLYTRGGLDWGRSVVSNQEKASMAS